MQFHLDDDQVELQRQMRRFGAEPQPWAAFGAMGVFSLLRGEDGMRPIDAVLVFEELGRALVPGPLLGSVVGGMLRTDIADDIADGSVVATLLDHANGEPHLVEQHIVEHLDAADVLIVVDDDGVRLVDVTAVRAEALADPLDPTTPVAIVRAVPETPPVLDAAGAAFVRRSVWMLSAALLSGNAAASLDVAVQYAKDRSQFGRAIGSFQAVKHMVADMHAAAELARVATHAAGVLAEDDRAVASARTVAGRAAIDNGATCIQVHGGMGFTWEAAPHRFYKRALALDALHGSTGRAAEAVADSLR